MLKRLPAKLTLSCQFGQIIVAIKAWESVWLEIYQFYCATWYVMWKQFNFFCLKSVINVISQLWSSTRPNQLWRVESRRLQSKSKAVYYQRRDDPWCYVCYQVFDNLRSVRRIFQPSHKHRRTFTLGLKKKWYQFFNWLFVSVLTKDCNFFFQPV